MFFIFRKNICAILIISALVFVSVFFIFNKVNAYGEIKGTSLGEFSSGCNYYVIEDPYGDYTLIEWYGGITPDNGEIMIGELHSYGFKDLYNISRDNSMHVYIDDWMLSEDKAKEKLIDKCGYDKNISTYFNSGYRSSYIPTYTPPIISTESKKTESVNLKTPTPKILNKSFKESPKAKNIISTTTSPIEKIATSTNTITTANNHNSITIKIPWHKKIFNFFIKLFK